MTTSTGDNTGARAAPGRATGGMPRAIADGFDVATVACAAETRRFAAFHADPSIVERMGRLEGAREASLVQGRLDLMQHGYRVDGLITPRLARLADTLRHTLRLQLPLDVFVQPDHDYNAYCLPSRRGNRLVMGLYSGLVSALGERELLFVMGHEIGHALLKHGETVRFDFGHPLFSFLETHQLRGLARAREITCDRIGLLACQDLRVATTAMFKVASGLNDHWIAFDEGEYARHFDELPELNELVELEGAGSTHPPMPLRVKALMAFARSERFAQAFGTDGWELSVDALERDVDAMLTVVDPDLTELESTDQKDAANGFIRAAALMVLAADGVVSPEEVEWLNRNIGTCHTVSSVETALTDAALLQEARQEAWRTAYQLRRTASEVARAGVLRTMCDVAACAGGIVDAERRVIDELRTALDVSVEMGREQLDAAAGVVGQVP